MIHNEFMENINGSDIAISPELGIDMDLVPLMDKEGVAYIDLRCYHGFRRGIDRIDIALYLGVSEEEVESAIHRVQRLLPPETLAVDNALRNEIIAIKQRSDRRSQQFHESLSKSIDDYLREGQDRKVPPLC